MTEQPPREPNLFDVAPALKWKTVLLAASNVVVLALLLVGCLR